MILVVDDDPLVLDNLHAILQTEGYRVEKARDGIEAFERVGSPECKCVLLDMNMPRINGAEFLLLMQAEKIETPVIVVTGFSDFRLDELKQFPNVVDLLEKPFTIEALRNSLGKCLPPASAAAG